MKYSFENTSLGEMIYPNTEAHNELKAMMNRNERIMLSFGIDRYGFEVVYPQSKTTEWFGYQLNPQNFQWLMGYLTEGKTEDFNLDPMKLEKSEYSDANTFRVEMLKMFIENKIGNLQFTPAIRDRSGKLSAVASFRYGIISFRVERTEELCDYLRDKNLIR